MHITLMVESDDLSTVFEIDTTFSCPDEEDKFAAAHLAYKTTYM
jgi:hypothetical protein